MVVYLSGGCPRVLSANIVTHFELQPRYYVHFHTNAIGKGNELPYPSMLWIK